MINLLTYLGLGTLGIFSAIKKHWLLIVLFILIPFYAFLITYSANLFHISFNELEIIRLFKEIILFGVFAGLIHDWIIKKNKITFLISDFFIGLYSLVLVGSIFVHGSSLHEALFGIRYDFFFLIYYIIFRLYFTFYADKKDLLLKIIFWTAIPIFVFGILQFFALPKDFLVHFGYAKEALATYNPDGPIAAFQLLGNSSLVRVQSFFSGPNQLAAYCLVIIFLALAKVLDNKKDILAYFVTILGIIILILTFSRSAWLGFAIGLIFLAIVNFKNKPVFSGLILGLILAAGVLGGFLFKGQLYEVIVRPSSSWWHLIYARDAYNMFLQHPFGIGLGKIGPASQWLGQPLLSESFYLQIGLEVGFFGVILFLAIMLILAWEIGTGKKQINFTAISIILSLLVASLFLNTLADGILAIYVGFALALAQTENIYLLDTTESSDQTIKISHE
jgi:O-antigen ligase